MGYRLVVAVLSLVFFCSCAAFDKDTDAVEGFGGKDKPGMPSVTKEAGALSGYYSGTMTLDSNTCQSISDEVGVESELALDLVQDGDTINLTFADDTKTSGMLNGEKATFMSEIMTVKHVYYFTFADDAISGSIEVIEADEFGQFGKPCASYTADLKKGEKPAAKDESGEEKKEDEEKK
jgi:hypothetical protein